MYQEYINEVQSSLVILSSDDLKDLLNDDDKLSQKVDESIVKLESQKAYLLSENRNKAEANIAKEPQLIEYRSRINDLLEEGKVLCSSIQDKVNLVKEKSGTSNPETALALLQTAAAEMEEESDKISQQFNEKELPVEEFIEKFLESRKTMHLRKFKAEKMAELMRTAHQPSNNSYNPSAFFPQPNMAPYPTGGGVPYPTGPTMPMPRF
ncbi:VPS37B family protein [Megaselia abdita]